MLRYFVIPTAETGTREELIQLMNQIRLTIISASDTLSFWEKKVSKEVLEIVKSRLEPQLVKHARTLKKSLDTVEGIKYTAKAIHYMLLYNVTLNKVPNR